MQRNSGFTLIELTIVLLLLGILSGLGLNYLKVTKKHQNYQSNQQLLSKSKQALLNFLAVNSYLPCPSENNNGYETRQSNGSCKVNQGHLPYLELGLTTNKDIYNNSILYAAHQNAKSNTQANNLRLLCRSASLFAKSGEINNKLYQCSTNQELFCLKSHCNTGCDTKDNCRETTLTKSTPTYAHQITQPLGTISSKLGSLTLCKETAKKCDSYTSPGQIAANIVPVILVSFGKNGRETWENFGDCDKVVSTKESLNCNGKGYFHQHPQSDLPANYFDDQFEWIDMHEAKEILNNQIYWR